MLDNVYLDNQFNYAVKIKAGEILESIGCVNVRIDDEYWRGVRFEYNGVKFRGYISSTLSSFLFRIDDPSLSNYTYPFVARQTNTLLQKIKKASNNFINRK